MGSVITHSVFPESALNLLHIAQITILLSTILKHGNL